MSSTRLRAVGWYVVLGLLAIVILTPIYLAIVQALSPPSLYARRGTPPYPVGWDWGVFGRAWDVGNLGSALGRSIQITILVTVAQVLTSLLSAYAFAYLEFPLKRLLFAVFIGTMLLPIEVTLLGNVVTIRQWGWIDSTQALVLPSAAAAFGTFLLRQGFVAIPNEVREAAMLDGYGEMRFLFRIAVPLCRPIIASLTVVTALTAWGAYLWHRAVIIDTADSATVPIALRTLASQATDGNVAVAGALLVSLPVLAVLIVFQRSIVKGLSAGAVKG